MANNTLEAFVNAALPHQPSQLILGRPVDDLRAMLADPSVPKASLEGIFDFLAENYADADAVPEERR